MHLPTMMSRELPKLRRKSRSTCISSDEGEAIWHISAICVVQASFCAVLLFTPQTPPGPNEMPATAANSYANESWISRSAEPRGWQMKAGCAGLEVS